MARWHHENDSILIDSDMLRRFTADKRCHWAIKTFLAYMSGCPTEHEPCTLTVAELAEMSRQSSTTIRRHLSRIAAFLERDRAEYGELPD